MIQMFHYVPYCRGTSNYQLMIEYNLWTDHAGFGTGMTFIVALTAAMRVFSDQWRGTIVSVVVSGSSIGPLVFMTIYQFIFAR